MSKMLDEIAYKERAIKRLRIWLSVYILLLAAEMAILTVSKFDGIMNIIVSVICLYLIFLYIPKVNINKIDVKKINVLISFVIIINAMRAYIIMAGI